MKNIRTYMRVLVGVVMAAVVMTFMPASALSTGSYETQVINRSNLMRSQHHLVKVKSHSCVDKYAESHARWMAKNRTLKHQSMSRVLKACKLKRVSENIAYGYSSGNNAVKAWMKSSGHRKNLLNSKMRYIGVGAVKDSRGVWWVAQVFGTKK